MYDFHFIFAGENVYNATNIEKISVETPDGIVELSGDAIMESDIPAGVMHLHGKDFNHTIPFSNYYAVNVCRSKPGTD